MDGDYLYRFVALMSLAPVSRDRRLPMFAFSPKRSYVCTKYSLCEIIIAIVSAMAQHVSTSNFRQGAASYATALLETCCEMLFCSCPNLLGMAAQTSPRSVLTDHLPRTHSSAKYTSYDQASEATTSFLPTAKRPIISQTKEVSPKIIFDLVATSDTCHARIISIGHY